MPHRNSFSWLIAIGVLCSLAGMARAWSAASAAEITTSAPRASAQVLSTTPEPVVSTAVVTQVPPFYSGTETPTEIAIAAATPTTTSATPLAVVARPVDSLPAGPTAAPQVELVQSPEKASQLVDQMNGARVEAGLPQLERDRALEEVALIRAKNLIDNGYFDHYAPDGESAFSELAVRGIRYRLAGENLARNNYVDARTVQGAFDGLMASAGHRANILEPRFSSVGVAAVQTGHMWVYVTVFTN